MRKQILILVLGFIASLVAAPGVHAQKYDDDGSQLIDAPYTYAAPTIDGELSAGEWDSAESNTVDYINLGVAGNGGPGASDGPDDASFTFSVMYDDDFLYIAVAVTDDIYISDNFGSRLQWDMPVTWENDAVEYFFDGDMSRTLESCRNPEETATGGQWIYALGTEDTALPFVAPEVYGGYDRPYGEDAEAVWFAQTTVDADTADWVQEARFALSIIGDPSAGSKIGFDIAIDDVDVYDETMAEPEQYTELRDIQLYWTAYLNDPGTIVSDNVHEIEDFWGTLNFLEPTHVLEWSIF